MVAVNNPANAASVLLGDGGGGFGTRTDYETGSGPLFVAVADLDGDRRPDVVTANGSGSVSVLLGHGDGTFGAKTDFGAGSDCYSVAIGDLDGDGIPRRRGGELLLQHCPRVARQRRWDLRGGRGLLHGEQPPLRGDRRPGRERETRPGDGERGCRHGLCDPRQW